MSTTLDPPTPTTPEIARKAAPDESGASERDPRTDLLVALNAAARITRSALCRLAADLEVWCDARPRNDADVVRLAASLGVPAEPLRRALRVAGRARRLATAERRKAAKAGCRIVTRLDAGYPAALLDHPLPPPLLYVRGRIPDGPAAAIVGSRRMDRYGKEAAELFGGGLARAGVTVVSGFALGVDQAAHGAAVDAGGKTVAVLGCGIDVPYPRRSRGLADRIAGSGAVISEFPLGIEPRGWHFPVRNRVIAALAQGTLVVQAKLRSGSLSTAHQTLDLGREVWAVPGRVFDELSLGTNGLIADGAALVTSPDDVLEEMGLGALRRSGVAQSNLFGGATGSAAGAATSTQTNAPPPADLPLPKGLGGKLVTALRERRESATAEDLAGHAGVTVDRVLAALLELELSGWVKRLPGPVYEL